MKNIFRSITISAVLIGASACGFHLRNSASMPSALAPIYIGGSVGNSSLGRKLRYQLTNSNTEVTEYSAQAAYQVMLLSETQDQRIISLDRRGLAAEYGLTLSVEFELRDKLNRLVLGPQKLDERRTITNNPDNALTTFQDVGIVRQDMEQVLAAQIVRRLGAYATNKLSGQPTAPAADNQATTHESSNTGTPQPPASHN